MAALGVAGSATLLAGTAQAVPFGTLAKLTWGKLLAAISIVGAAAAVPVGYFAWQRHHPAQARRRRRRPSSRRTPIGHGADAGSAGALARGARSRRRDGSPAGAATPHTRRDRR